MSIASACQHVFVALKSDNTLMEWYCNMCHSGPHWVIWECQNCKLHTCKPCSQNSC